VGVCDDGDKAGGADDGAAGVATGDDIRGVQLAGGCKHAVGVCDDGDKAGGADWRTETISEEFNSEEVANTLWAFVTMGTKPGERMMEQLE
jgi:hypothetical protein